jgi:hypothetical protein
VSDGCCGVLSPLGRTAPTRSPPVGYQLAEVVRAGKTHADPASYDDPMSFYEPGPDLRVAKWLRATWRRRG